MPLNLTAPQQTTNPIVKAHLARVAINNPFPGPDADEPTVKFTFDMLDANDNHVAFESIEVTVADAIAEEPDALTAQSIIKDYALSKLALKYPGSIA